MERSDRMWSTGEGNGTTLKISCLENPMNSMRRQKDITLKDELPRLVGAHYANEEAESKQKQHPVVDVSGGESKV